MSTNSRQLALSLDMPISYKFYQGEIALNPHCQSEIEIIYVLEKNLTVLADDQIFELAKEEIYILNAGVNHCFKSPYGGEVLTFHLDCNCLASPFFLESMCFLIDSLDNMKVHSSSWDIETKRRVQKYLDNIFQELSSRHHFYEYQVMADLWSLMTVLLREIPRKEEQKLKTNPRQRDLKKVYQYVEENYRKEIYLEDVAQHLGYNSQYFSRFFKENTGKTFKTFLNDYRLSIAKWLLITENYTVSEVAHCSGFKSSQSFYRVFKQRLKMTPLQYQKQFSK